MLLDESLIAKENSDAFFERIISASKSSSYEVTDYDFQSGVQRTWSVDDAESVFDQENDYKIYESEDGVQTWRRRYIDSLFARNENEAAAAIIDEAEKQLNGKNARPEWLRLARLRAGVRSGHFDQAQAERFIGVTVADAVTEIKPPSLERFNEVLHMLKDENADALIVPLSESYFGRELALGQYDKANFVGLARTIFKQGQNALAIRLLQLMVDVSSKETVDAASAEISSLKAVKAHAPDYVRTGDDSFTNIAASADAMALAADVSVEFGNTKSAIAFRSELMNASPANISNRLKLSELLAASGDKKGAIELLTQLVADSSTARADRWQAKWQSQKIGGNVDLAGLEYDPYPQFYGGLLALGSSDIGSANTLFIGSLIAGTGNETSARRELIRSYATNGRPFAALKLSESDTSEKDDDLLGVLSAAAEQIGEYAKAIELEKQKSGGGDADRVTKLQQLSEEASRRATDLIVDSLNTRKL